MAAVTFGILGVETCLWNSVTSIAEVKTIRSKRTAAFRVGSVSFLLLKKYEDRMIET